MCIRDRQGTDDLQGGRIVVYNWFHKTDIDQRFYEEHIRERLPQRIVDAHVHMNLEKHVKKMCIRDRVQRAG